MRLLLAGLFAGALLVPPAAAGPRTHGAQDPPRVLLDMPLRAVEYQLGRLTNEELILVERKPEDVKYRPVYVAILIRSGIPPQYRDEALDALTTMGKTSRSVILMDALAKVPADDALTADKLIALLLSQPVGALSAHRDVFGKAIDVSSQPWVPRAAYAALLVADGKPDRVWQMAAGRGTQIIELLRSVRYLPSSGKPGDLGPQLFAPIATLQADAKDPSIRAEALAALGFTRRDGATFEVLAQAAIKEANADARAAALRSLQALPEAVWPPAASELLARSIVTRIGELSAEARTEPAALDAIQFGERLSAKLPPETGRAIRRDLRTLGVRVVRIETVPEKLAFDVRWFAVEAGKPVQIALVNPDAMPHNLVVSQPGSLEQVGAAGGAMAMPTDPNVKAFVPDSPLVLHATKLLKEGETERLGFTAPKQPGEYVFVCTFPGHWVRMYGVMLVVASLDEWESKPTVPIDPMTKQPFTSQRN